MCIHKSSLDAPLGHKAWLKGGSSSKDQDSMSLELKVVAISEDPKLQVDAMWSYPWA